MRYYRRDAVRRYKLACSVHNFVRVDSAICKLFALDESVVLLLITKHEQLKSSIHISQEARRPLSAQKALDCPTQDKSVPRTRRVFTEKALHHSPSEAENQ